MTEIQKNAELKTLVGKTIRSREAVSGAVFYFWAQFTEQGISYGIGDSVNPTFNTPLPAVGTAFSDYVATFRGNVNGHQQAGTITIEVAEGLIKNVKVKFSEGTDYNNTDINCQFVNE